MDSQWLLTGWLKFGLGWWADWAANAIPVTPSNIIHVYRSKLQFSVVLIFHFYWNNIRIMNKWSSCEPLPAYCVCHRVCSCVCLFMCVCKETPLFLFNIFVRFESSSFCSIPFDSTRFHTIFVSRCLFQKPYLFNFDNEIVCFKSHWISSRVKWLMAWHGMVW